MREIPLSKYSEKLAHVSAKNGDEGFKISAEDEKILDSVWENSAKKRGITPIKQPLTEEEIKNF